MEAIYDILYPVLVIVAPLAVGYALFLFSKSTGMELDAKNREALQSALTNAALVAFAKASGKNPIPDAAVRYVKESVPDAVKNFNLSDQRIRELIEPKLIKTEIEAAKPQDAAGVDKAKTDTVETFLRDVVTRK